MTEPAATWRAPLWRRAAARMLDTCVMAVIEAVMIFVTFMISAFIAGGVLNDEHLVEFGLLWLVLLVLASIPVYRFEVGATARSGQTWAKGLAEVQVVRWDGEAPVIGEEGSVERRRCRLRFAIPHVAGVVAAVIAVVAAIVVLPSEDAGNAGNAGNFWGTVAGAFAVPWALVYASSLLDKNRRGWHDKAAGTIVVRATDDVLGRLATTEPEPFEHRSTGPAAARHNPHQLSSYVQYWDEYLAGHEGSRPEPDADDPDPAR